MKAMTNDDFAKAVLGMAKPGAPFKPQVAYIPEGDCLEFLISDDDYYAERIDGLVTVYYSRDTGEIVGSLVKGVKGFCEKMAERYPGFGIEIEAGRVRLSYLFQMQLWSKPRESNDVEVRTYRRLIEAAEETGAMAELCV